MVYGQEFELPDSNIDCHHSSCNCMMAEYRFSGEHMYKNLVLQATQKDENVDKIKDMCVVDGDILVATYPKTGKTWMEELTYVIKHGGDTTEALQTPLQQRMCFLEHMFDFYDEAHAGIDMLRSSKRPAIMKTHLPAWQFEEQLQEGRLKVILVIRNPKDTLVSLYHFYRMNKDLGNFMGSWDDFFELYKTKHILYGDYFDWYSSWVPHLDKPNVQLYTYEDMKHKTRDIIMCLGGFLKSNNMVNGTGVSNWRQDISKFMRKGEVGDRKNYFSPEQSYVVDDEFKTKLETQGITLQFE